MRCAPPILCPRRSTPTPARRRSGPLALGAASAVLGLLAAPTPARAGGYYVADIEAVGLGQAGAFVAAPYTPAAVWYNPGALAFGKGLRLELEGAFIHSPLTYRRAPDDSEDAYPDVTNDELFLPAVFAGAAHDLGVENLAVALAVYTPSSNHYAYSDQGPQRFQSVNGRYIQVHFHAAVAYRFFGKLAVGAALGGSYFTATQRTLLSGALFGDPENPDFTIPVDIDLTSPFTFTSNFGVSFRPIPQIALGVSFMPPFDVAGSGKARVQLPPALADLGTVEGDAIDGVVRFPAVLRAGARVTPISELSVELAAVYESWSRLDSIDIQPDITVTAPIIDLDESPIGEIKLTKNYQDVVSVRLGVETRPFDLFTFRAGGYYESSAARKGYFDVSSPDADKGGLALGASLHLPYVDVDVAYAHVFAPTVVEDASKLEVVNVLAPENTRTIGNGTYDFSFDILHLGVRAHFGGDPAR